jgi:heme/copper-type cytochrome/quinol oxidase subunit 2
MFLFFDTLLKKTMLNSGLSTLFYLFFRGLVSFFKTIESVAPGILLRQSVKEACITFWKIIDLIIRLGRRQRALIIGDRQTGKSSVGTEGIASQSVAFGLSLKLVLFSVCVFLAVYLFCDFSFLNAAEPQTILAATDKEIIYDLKNKYPYARMYLAEFWNTLPANDLELFIKGSLDPETRNYAWRLYVEYVAAHPEAAQKIHMTLYGQEIDMNSIVSVEQVKQINPSFDKGGSNDSKFNSPAELGFLDSLFQSVTPSAIANTELHLYFLTFLMVIFIMVIYLFSYALVETWGVQRRFWSGLKKLRSVSSNLSSKTSLSLGLSRYFLLSSSRIADFVPFSKFFTECKKSEASWSIYPIIFVFTAGLCQSVAFAQTAEVHDNAFAPEITIKVTANQWFWQFEYADLADSENHTLAFSVYPIGGSACYDKNIPLEKNITKSLVIPVGSKIRLLVTSADVVHALFIPFFDVKIDAVPGRVNEVSFTALEPGIFKGTCAELCGAGHSVMPFFVTVCHPFDYFSWVKFSGFLNMMNRGDGTFMTQYFYKTPADNFIGSLEKEDRGNDLTLFWFCFFELLKTGYFWNIENRGSLLSFLRKNEIDFYFFNFLNRLVQTDSLVVASKSELDSYLTWLYKKVLTNKAALEACSDTNSEEWNKLNLHYLSSVKDWGLITKWSSEALNLEKEDRLTHIKNSAMHLIHLNSKDKDALQQEIFTAVDYALNTLSDKNNLEVLSLKVSDLQTIFRS